MPLPFSFATMRARSCGAQSGDTCGHVHREEGGGGGGERLDGALATRCTTQWPTVVCVPTQSGGIKLAHQTDRRTTAWGRVRVRRATFV